MADMDLGNLFIHLKADDTGVTKAFNNWIKGIEEVGKASLGLSEALKAANSTMEDTKKQTNSLATVCKNVALSVYEMAKSVTGASTAFQLMGKVIDTYFLPLKKVVEIMTLLKGTINFIGVASVKAAGELDFMYRKLSTIIKDSQKLGKAWKEGMNLSDFFTPKQTIDAELKLQRVGIVGKEAMETIRDAAIMLDESIEEVATSIVRMSAGTLRGLRLMGVDFIVEGNKYMFQYRNQFDETVESTVYGVKAAQQEIMRILRDMFGGAYENIKTSIPGLMRRFSTEFIKLRYAFGKGMLPVFGTLGEDVIKQMKELIPLAERLGESLGKTFEKIRQNLMIVVDYIKEIITSVAGAIEQKSIGFVIQNAFHTGAMIFIDLFLAAVSASWTLWKAIFTMGADIFLEAFSKIKGFEWIGAGVRKQRIEIALENLSLEELKKLTDLLGGNTENLFGKEFTKEQLIKSIAFHFMLAPTEEVKSKLREAGKEMGVAIEIGFGTELDKAYEKTRENFVESGNKFLLSLKKEAGLFKAKMDAAAGIYGFVKQSEKQEDFFKKMFSPGSFHGYSVEPMRPPVKEKEDFDTKRIMDDYITNLKIRNNLEGLNTKEKQKQQGLMDAALLIGSRYVKIIDKQGKIFSKQSEDYQKLTDLEKERYELGIEKLELIEQELDELDKIQRSYKQVGIVIENWANDADNVWRHVGEVAVTALDGISGAITNMMIKQKVDFKALARSIMVDLLQIIVRAMMAKAIMAAIGFVGVSPGAGAGAGAGAGTGPISATGAESAANWTPQAKGGIFDMGKVIPFASGGILGGGVNFVEDWEEQRMNALLGIGMGMPNQLGFLLPSWQRKLLPFADGGIVSSPKLFPMAQGNVGLMGENGPEAVMPLARDSGGRLGVRSSGEQQSVVNNIKVVNVLDKSEILAALSGSAGEQVIVNAIKRNKGLISGVLR